MSFSSYNRGRSFGSPRSRYSRSPQRSYINKSKYVSRAVGPTSQVEVYTASNTFSDFGLDERLLQNVVSHGYSTPTPIQDQAIPALMKRKDVIGIANTGTGKTAAFLLPLIDKVLKDSEQGVLVLAPTRELALQIFDELKAFTSRLPLGIALCIGGMGVSNQIERLRQNPHFVIGTPGRIKDLINKGAFNTAMFKNIVLDEVDRMLDIGFRKDILILIAKLPPDRHCALFSATINREAQEIIQKFLSDPVTISVKKSQTVQHIDQDIVRVLPGQNKTDVLHSMLILEKFTKVIVFGRTKHGINKLEQQLYERGTKVSSIHGNKSQNARQRSLTEFKQGRVQALLATDIAARGLDIEGVTHVINFDEPMTYDDYVHRIGRTGRAGKAGKALTFVTSF